MKKLNRVLAMMLAVVLLTSNTVFATGVPTNLEGDAEQPSIVQEEEHQPEPTPGPVVVTPEPVVELTPEPVVVTPEPVVVTPEPVIEPTSEPVVEPTPEPVAGDVPVPEVTATPEPTATPTVTPTPAPRTRSIAAQEALGFGTVAVNLYEGNMFLGTETVEGGDINKAMAPVRDGFVFTGATVYLNNTNYDIVFMFSADGQRYIARNATDTTAMQLEANAEIRFHYTKLENKASITYVATGENEVAGNTYEGNALVEKGKDLEIRVTAALGYKAEVSVGGANLIAERLENFNTVSIYKLLAVNADTTVTIHYVKAESFTSNVSWAESENLKGVNSSRLHGATVTTDKASFAQGETIVWTIGEVKSQEFQIDSLSINNEFVDVPRLAPGKTEFQVGNSNTSTMKEGLNAGIQVTVAVSKVTKILGSEYAYRYTVTIENAKTDVALTLCNLRAKKWGELMPVELLGVDAQVFVNGNKWQTLTQSDPVAKWGKTGVGENTINIRYKLKNGYTSPTFSGVGYAAVTPNGEENGYQKATITCNALLTTLSIRAELMQYSVVYDVLGGEGVGNSPELYTVNKPTVMVASKIPTREGYFFKGWKLTNTGARYAPGTTFDINSLDLATIAPNKTLTFEAIWEAGVPAGAYANHVIGYYLQTATGQYVKVEALGESVPGILNTIVIKRNPENKLTYAGNTYSYVSNLSNLVGRLTANAQELITLSYSKDVRVTYEKGAGTVSGNPPIDNTIYAIGGTATVMNGGTLTRADGAILTGWQVKGTNTVYPVGGTIQNLAFEGVTLVPVWKQVIHDVSFIAASGGTLQQGNVTNTSFVTKISNNTAWGNNEIPTPVANEGFYFTGWSAALPTSSTVITAPLTITAQFAEKTVIAAPLAADSASKEYDKTALTAGGLSAESTAALTALGLTAEVTMTATSTITDVIAGGVGNQIDTIVLKNAAGNDVTGQYTFTTANGKLVVTPRAVAYTLADVSITLGAEIPTNFSGTFDRLIDGDKVQMTGKLLHTPTLIGDYAFLITAEEQTPNPNYTITVKNGTLSVLGTVTYNANGGSGALPQDTGRYKHEATYTVLNKTNTLTREKAIFKGWSLQPIDLVSTLTQRENAEPLTLAANTVLQMGQQNVILYAVWWADADEDGTAEVGQSQVQFATNNGKWGQLQVGTTTIDSHTFNVIYPEKDTNAVKWGVVTGETVLTSDQIAAIGSAYNSVKIPTPVPASGYRFVKWDSTFPNVNEVLPPTTKLVYTAQFAPEITVTNTEATYDGNSYGITVNGAAQAGEMFQYSTDGQQWVNQAIEFKDAGVYTVYVRLVVGNTVYWNGQGTVTISPTVVNITSATDSKEFDNKPLTNHGITATGFVGEEGATYSVDGSQTAVGSTENTFTYVLKKNTRAGNYSITATNGTLTVTNRSTKWDLTLVGKSKEVDYTGQPQSVQGLVQTSFVVDGSTYTVTGATASATGTDAGDYAANVTGNAIQIWAGTKDVTAQFNVTLQPGSLRIKPRAITMTSGSEEKTYNGQPLTNTEVVVTGAGFADDEGASYTVTGSITRPGTAENSFGYTLQAGTKAANYSITTVVGTLKIKEVPQDQKLAITLTGVSAAHTYSGTAHTATGFVATTFMVNGAKFTVNGLKAAATGTDVGKYATVATGTASVMDADNVDVTEQFQVTTMPGTLVIHPKKLTLTSGSATKIFNGTALTNQTVNADGFVLAQGASYTVTGSQTTVGQSENAFTYVLNKGTKADNYDITTQNGVLTVQSVGENKIPVTLVANSLVETYNGTAQTVSGLVETSFIINGTTFTVVGLTATATGTNAGTYTANVVGTPVVKSGNDVVTDQFAFTFVAGKLTITPALATITADQLSMVYGGVEPALTGTVKGLKAGDTLSGIQYSRPAGQNVGEYEVTASVDGAANPNYTVAVVSGKLTIIPAQVTVAVTDTAKNYGQRDPNFTITTMGLVGKDVLAGVSFDRAPGETVGKYVVNAQVDGAQNPNYTIKTITPGALTIGAVAVTVTVTNTEKTYGNVDPVFTSTTSALVGEDTLTGIVYKRAEGENVGGYAITASADANPNYTVSFVPGTLTITPAKVVVTADNQEKTYGDADPTLTGSAVGLVKGDSLKGISYNRAEGDNAGKYAITGSVAASQNPNYTVDFVPGILTINKKQITATVENSNKVYGTTDPDVKVTVNGLVGGDTLGEPIIGRVNGENVGDYAVTVQYPVNPNYEITAPQGILTITPASLTIKAEAAEKIMGQQDPTLTGQVTGLVKGDTMNITVTRTTGEDVGAYTITPGYITNGNYVVNVETAVFTVYGKVNYDVNGGNETITDDGNYNLGNTVTVTTDAVTRENARFLGWSTERFDLITSSVQEATALATVVTQTTMGTRGVTLYAVWAQDANGSAGQPDGTPDYYQFALAYNGNGGTGTMTDNNIYSVGENVAIAANGFTNTGYTFVGWNTAANGAGTAYAAGGTVPMVAGGVTLFAQWTLNAVVPVEPTAPAVPDPTVPDVTPDTTPGTAAPATPATPETATPVAAVVVETPVVVPAVVPAPADDTPAGYELRTLPDEEVPLANVNLDDENAQCCVLSLLIMLLTLIVGFFYTRSMKKYQERINKLRQQIAAEGSSVENV